MINDTYAFTFSTGFPSPNFQPVGPILQVPAAATSVAAVAPAQPPESTLAELIRAYRKFSTCGEAATRNNISSMLKVIERASGRRQTDAPLSVLNEWLVSDYQAAMIADYCEAAAKDEAAQREARQRALRSSRSTVCQARGLFSSKNVDLLGRYRTEGLIIPESVRGFLACKLRGKRSSVAYCPAEDAVIKRTFEAIWEKQEEDPALFLAFWLAAGAGLRRGEIRRCQWEHIIDRQGRTWIVGGIGKNSEKIDIPMQSRAAEAIKPFRKPAGKVVIGSDWDRRLWRWMRGLGWESDKLIHELRAYLGSLVYQQNPVAAMRLLRHQSIAITESAYLRYQTAAKPVEVL